MRRLAPLLVLTACGGKGSDVAPNVPTFASESGKRGNTGIHFRGGAVWFGRNLGLKR